VYVYVSAPDCRTKSLAYIKLATKLSERVANLKCFGTTLSKENFILKEIKMGINLGNA
jgi:hypothetical protein